MRGQRKNPKKAVQPFENKKRKIDIFKNYEANGVEKIQRKLEIFSTLISKKSTEPTNSTKADGLGLGLQIVRSIIENHGGKISFSQATSGGLRVEIRLPVQEETK